MSRAQVHINDKFAQFSEALFVADRHAREEVHQRSLMMQRIAAKKKEQDEENLRSLAQRAREERSGTVVVPGGGASRVAGSMPAAVAGYGSDSDEADSQADTDDGRPSAAPAAAGGARRPIAADLGSSDEGSDDDEDRDDAAAEKAARVRDEQRAERRRDREREMRMNNMGNEKRAQMLARQQNRDISEKIALGLAKPTMSKESMLDSRLFNQEQLSGSFGDDESYNLYDKPLFSGSSAAAAIYKSGRGVTGDEGDDERYGGGTEEGVGKQLRNDRFGLGVAGRGFEGADLQETRDGCVASVHLFASLLFADIRSRFVDPARSSSSAIRPTRSPSTPSWTRPPKRDPANVGSTREPATTTVKASRASGGGTREHTRARCRVPLYRRHLFICNSRCART